MKKKNRNLYVCIVSGIIAVCFVALLVAGIISVNIGRLYPVDTGTYPIDDDIPDCTLTEAVSRCRFEARYIRTDGSREDIKYPVVKIIRSVDELNTYYELNKEIYDLERRENFYSDSTIGFSNACDKYDEAYFENQILVMVLIEEGSGSTRHKVDNVELVGGSEMVVNICTLVPEAGTCDMAEWHILIEPEAGVDVETESDVTVFIDGINPLTQSVIARHDNYSNISLTIPNGWEHEIEDDEDKKDFCIAFWPTGQSEGKIKVWYYSAFGVCGTGLEKKKITLGSYEAYQGTYDGRKAWDFIILEKTPGTYVIMNEGDDIWWDRYGDEAMQILNTLVVGEGIISEAEAIEIAKKEVTVGYNETQASFDAETGCWTVTFYKKNTAGGCQDIVITGEGKVVDTKNHSVDALVPKPEDTSLEFWITENVENVDFSTYNEICGWMGAREFYGKGCESVADADGNERKPLRYVSYLITAYPDYADGGQYVTQIEITDPGVSVYGLTVNSTFEEYDAVFGRMGFTISIETDSEGAHRRFIAEKYGSIRFIFHEGDENDAEYNPMLIIKAEVTNREGILF